MLLNFGHTVGHAIEACCQYKLRHGECVALGIVAACRLSNQLGMIDQTVVTRTITLLSRIGLPVVLLTPLDTDRIINTMRSDKKIKDGVSRLILLEGIGQPVIRSDVPEYAIRQAYESLVAAP